MLKSVVYSPHSVKLHAGYECYILKNSGLNQSILNEIILVIEKINYADLTKRI